MIIEITVMQTVAAADSAVASIIHVAAAVVFTHIAC
jgi:hypothetical protein